jgi:hypothetical protein
MGPDYNPSVTALPAERQTYDFNYSVHLAAFRERIVWTLLANPNSYLGPNLLRYVPEV